MTTIAEQLNIAQQRIDNASKKYAPLGQKVSLLAVSKTKPCADIISAYNAGQRCFGENYVQEGVDKICQLKDEFADIEWHFIGPLQSNKSRLVAAHFHWFHTVDRAKIAQRLAQQRPENMQPLNVCIQINISKEATKSGVGSEADMFALAAEINQLPQLTLRGLMAIPKAGEQEQLLKDFAQMQRLYQKLKSKYVTVDTLSMGMSQDLEQAIAHGSTMVRIGSAIFGKRQ